MKKLFVVALVICFAFTALCGCKKNDRNDQNEVLDNIIANMDSYECLTQEEFLGIIEGKTTIGKTDESLPRDKACYTAENGLDYTCYVVEGGFIFSCYIHRTTSARSMFTLDYIKDGAVAASSTEFSKFAEFIAEHTGAAEE